MKPVIFTMFTLLFGLCAAPLAASSHCHCTLASTQGSTPVLGIIPVVKNFGDIHEYTNLLNQDLDNQHDCENRCASAVATWAANQSAVCDAFGTANANDPNSAKTLLGQDIMFLRAFAAVGTRDYVFTGAALTPSRVSKMVLNPRFYLLTILYALPGCDPTGPGYNCSSKSSATYSNGSSMATTASIQSTFNTGVTTSADASETFKLGSGSAAPSLGLAMGSSNSFSVTSTSGSSETVSKSSTTVLTAVAAITDGIDHGMDQFQLLLNPVIVLTHDCTKYGSGTGWNMGFTPPSMVLQKVTACQILNTCSPASPMPASVINAKLTESDYCSILAQDPFVPHCAPGLSHVTLSVQPTNLGEAYPGRFEPTVFEPAYNAPVSGICNGVFQDTISNSLQGSITSTAQTQATITSSLSAAIGVAQIASFGIKSANSMTFTNSASTVAASNTVQTASATVACAGSKWTNAYNQIAIYWDRIYGSFLFYPMTFAGQHVIHQGTVSNASGGPAPYVPVQLSYGRSTYHTSTGASGEYKIYSSSIQADAQHPLPAILSVAGLTVNVMLGSATPTQVHLPTPAQRVPSGTIAPVK